MTEHDIPRERDLPAGRLTQLKDDVMAQIEQDINKEGEAEPRATPLVARRRARRVGLVAAAAAAAFVLTGVVALRGDDSASASPNFAERTDGGFVRVHIEELDDPEQVERDLEELGVPAVVDIHEGGGQRCDDARSDGWVVERPTRSLIPSPDEGGDDIFDITVNPDELRSGETMAIEFFWDEHDGDWVTMASYRTSMSPIGECELAEAPEIVVDAENLIVGG